MRWRITPFLSLENGKSKVRTQVVSLLILYFVLDWYWNSRLSLNSSRPLPFCTRHELLLWRRSVKWSDSPRADWTPRTVSELRLVGGRVWLVGWIFQMISIYILTRVFRGKCTMKDTCVVRVLQRAAYMVTHTMSSKSVLLWGHLEAEI